LDPKHKDLPVIRHEEIQLMSAVGKCTHKVPHRDDKTVLYTDKLIKWKKLQDVKAAELHDIT
jgi:hypothetical protein